ncbi:MAG: Ig-like domain-containing protein [Bacteroidota bacterium]
MKRILACLFLICGTTALFQCARRGNPTGGPKDVDPPVLLRADPENMSVNFDAKVIKLYFDEYVKLKSVQEQLIVSPPLKYLPEISPQGGADKVVEIRIKDTLKENTTYTFNFGQSITDNNEGNPNSFLTYVFSTGDYIDSLNLTGVVKDAYTKEADEFISVMLYELDTAYTDSTIYQRPPNYITNTLDSTIIFNLRNLKEGKYALFGLKDEAKNNVFDQGADKIAFLQDTISLPTDSIYLLTLFKEVPDYAASVPSLVAQNRILFGYYGDGEDIAITPLSPVPDTVRTRILKEYDRDSLNFWFTPFERDSLIFTVTNEKLKVQDTFTVKSRKVAFDSLALVPNQSGSLDFNDPFFIRANTPLETIDTLQMSMLVKDSIPMVFTASLDRTENKVDIAFDIAPNENYALQLLPGAITDLFGETNDTLNYTLRTKSLADYGNLTLNVTADPYDYPLLVQLTDTKGKTVNEIYAEEPQLFEFTTLEPSSYLVRVIFDRNKNGQWDTGNYLKRIQPEKVTYYPNPIELRANWELQETFILLD